MISRAAFFGGVSLVAGIAVVVLWRQLQEERIRSAQLGERITQLEQRPPPAPVVLQAAAVPGPDAPAPATAAAVVPVQSPPVPEAANMVVAQAIVQRLARDPDLCVAQKATLRARMIQTYPDVGKVLGLPPAQSSALTELLLRHQEVGLNCAPEDSGDQPRLAGKALADAQQAEIEALLGPAKYQEFQEYLPTREGRLNVNRLRDALSTSDTPLTDAQAGPLLNSVLAEGKRNREERAARIPPAPADLRARLDFEEETLRRTEESQARLLASTQSYLSPQQIAVMRNSMTAVNARQRALLKAQRARLEAGASTDATEAAPLVVAPR